MVKRKRVNWAEWNAWLAEHYQDMTTREIAEHIGCSMEAIKQQANKRKLVKFPDDISFFENWSHESAYIIGLWAADGYANVRPGKGVAVCISQSHGGGILDRIQDLSGGGAVYEIPQRHSRRIEWYSRKLYEFLLYQQASVLLSQKGLFNARDEDSRKFNYVLR